MKKFSNNNINEPVSKTPKDTNIKLELTKLIENILSIRTYGPVDRYLRQGSIEISGKEMLVEAILDLISTDDKNKSVKLLESLKYISKDVQSIDKKIDEIKSVENNSLAKRKINEIVERYSNPEMQFLFIKNKIGKMNKSNLISMNNVIHETNLNKDIISQLLPLIELQIKKDR